ncbi:MAG: GH116 family glycosyl-hydrolase [Planctomycetota bacterium]|jgi:hypothetical protein
MNKPMTIWGAKTALPSLLLAVLCAGAQARHLVPADKKLDPAWVKSLSSRGERTTYQGDGLNTIGMPVGGIASGQLYLGGDGRLLYWDIFNRYINTGWGENSYRTWKPASPVDQGFAIRVASGGKEQIRILDRRGFSKVTFVGEYPVGIVEYRDEAFPVRVTLKAFSPFIPLNVPDSSLPATVLQFTVENPGAAGVDVTLTGWLENAVGLFSRDRFSGHRRNRLVRGENLWFLECSAGGNEPEPGEPSPGPPEVFADFEGADWGRWKVKGDAFGPRPARGTHPDQQPVGGYRGRGLVNSFRGGDGTTGMMVSPKFTIARPYINFLIGGGNRPGRACIRLVDAKKVLRSATGKNNERLEWRSWDVKDLAGKEVRIEILDHDSGGWGHINVDQIEFSGRSLTAGSLETQGDFGTLGLGLLGGAEGAKAWVVLPDVPELLFADEGIPPGGPGKGDTAVRPLKSRRSFRGALGRKFPLKGSGKQTVTFLVTWVFPNHVNGREYANRFQGALQVAEHVAKDFDRLAADTECWRRTVYDSTLPHWFLERIHAPVANLATSVVQWWSNGTFWSWEGVG